MRIIIESNTFPIFETIFFFLVNRFSRKRCPQLLSERPSPQDAIYSGSFYNVSRIRVTVVDRKVVKIAAMAANSFFTARHWPRRHCDKTRSYVSWHFVHGERPPRHTLNFSRSQMIYQRPVKHEFQSGQKRDLRTRRTGQDGSLSLNLHEENWSEVLNLWRVHSKLKIGSFCLYQLYICS